MKKNYAILSLLILFTSSVIFSQVIDEGFENLSNECYTAQNPFLDGCVPDFIETHGNPFLINSFIFDGETITSPDASATFCRLKLRDAYFYCSETPFRGGGFAIKHNFEPGCTYKVTCETLIPINDNEVDVNWVLTSGLIEQGGGSQPNGCSPGQVIPETPENNHFLPSLSGNGTEWVHNEQMFTIEENADYSQLWFRAKLDLSDANDGQTSMFIDNIKIEKVCCDLNSLISPDIKYDCQDDGSFNVTVFAVDTDVEQTWYLYETSTNGGVGDADVITGTFTEEHSGVSTTTFTGLNSSHFYFIKHVVWDENCPRQETRVALIELDCCQLNSLFDTEYECNEDFTYNVTFTPRDETLEHAWYFYTRDEAGNWTIIEHHDPAASGAITFSNLNPNNEYRVKHIVWTAFCPRQETRLVFEAPDCCDTWDYDADFWFHTGVNYSSLLASSFNTAPGVTHEWYLISSPNDGDGPFTPLAYLTSTDETEIVLYNNPVSDVFYTVAHIMTTPCGEFCETRELQFEKSDVQQEAGLAEIEQAANGAIPCEKVNIYPHCGKAPLGVPTDLSLGLVIASNNYQASWTAASSADYYVVSFVKSPTITCDCDNLFYAPLTYTTQNTSISIPNFIGIRCFVWQVTAFCNGKAEGVTSEEACYNGLGDFPGDSAGGKSFSEPTPSISIYPNPANNLLNVKLPSGSYNIQIRDIMGKIHYTQDVDTQTEIDTQHFSSGVYLLKVVNVETKESEVLKIVIQH